MHRLKPLLFATLAILMACSNEAPIESAGEASTEPSPAEASAPAGEDVPPARESDLSAAATRVTGTIKGTQVELVEAELDNQLAIFEKDNWGFSPSLLIFMFLDEGESPEGRTFSVAPEDEMSFDVSIPHVHYRWRAGEEDDIESEVVSMDYTMELKFGQIENGELPGTITFSVPDEDTSVTGTFRAKVED